jgi:hypothetical protein
MPLMFLKELIGKDAIFNNISTVTSLETRIAIEIGGGSPQETGSREQSCGSAVLAIPSKDWLLINFLINWTSTAFLFV